ADVDQRLAEMEVPGGESAAVVDVDDASAEEEGVDQRDHAGVRGADGCAEGAAEVDAEMAAGNLAVEGAAGAESAADRRVARLPERCSPLRGRLLRLASHGDRALVLPLDARRSRRVERFAEARSDGELLLRR